MSSVHLFADAAYGVHADGKSHSADVVTVGNAAVKVKSQKQKIVTKSAESELVCVSDMMGLGYHVKDFLEGQKVFVDAIDLHEDNTSTISMSVNYSENPSYSCEIFNFIKERIDSQEVRVQHTPTDDMVADLLTTPIQGVRFIRLRDLLLNFLS